MARESFKLGYTYIVRDPKRGLWYLVQQTGAKSWVATNFTHIGLGYEDKVIKGNGGGLWRELSVSSSDKYVQTASQQLLRMKMFNVLKYGTLSDAV